MPSSNGSDDSETQLLCAPPKKAKGPTTLGNCNGSVVCSTQRSAASMSKICLSLSQRKRQCSTSAKRENDFSEDDDDIIPASQKHFKPTKSSSFSNQNAHKKARLDLCIDDSEPELIEQRSPQVYEDIRFSPNLGNQPDSSTLIVNTFPTQRASFLLDDVIGLSPSRVEEVSKNQNFKQNEDVDGGSNKTSQSTILSFGLTPKSKKRSSTANLSMPSNEQALLLQQTTFSSNGNSKEDFIRHWVDSCPLETEIGPLETQDLIDVPGINQRQDDSMQSLSSGSETQPLLIGPTDCLALEMSSDDKASRCTPEKRTVLPLIAVEEDPVPSTSGVVSTCTASLLITPPKKTAANGRTSTGSSRQTTVTDFFTPNAKTPLKPPLKSDITQLQMRSCINELTQDKEFQYSETLSIQTGSVKATPAEAKAQWSQLMSKMRGTAKNLKREMKQSEKRKSVASIGDESSVSTKPETSETQRRCPFYKRIPGTNFAIDAFNYGRIPGVTCYFLSHFHYDHYRGLGKWIDKPVYCSKVTANLIQLKIKLPTHLIRVIPLNEPRVVENVEVVLVDANHCPGAVMFLFRFPTGRCVLHVGDFRAHPSMGSVRELTRSPISELYLDTTYCDPNYDFPAQDEVVAYVRRLVRKYMQRHPKLLVVSGTYTIGKEKVFMAAAEELDCKIWAPTVKRTILERIEDPNLSKRIATNPTDDRVRVHVVNMSDINPRNLKSYLDTLNGKFTHILALNPTGWEYDGKTAIKGLDGIQPKVFQGSIFIYGVPYSEHSGFSEMKQFVQRFKPGKIIPTVNVGSAQQRAKMDATFNEWLGRRRPFKTS